MLQPFGREVDDLLQAHRAAQQTGDQDGVRWDALVEVTLMTTSRGPFEEDVFFVLAYDDGSNGTIPLGDAEYLLPRLQELPGFDNETVHPGNGRQRRKHLLALAPMNRMRRTQQIGALY